MGIYIDNIEMPKGHNHLTINIWPNGTTSYGVFNRQENLCTFRHNVLSRGSLCVHLRLSLPTLLE